MATIADVARQAGVSVSTVSYALSGARPIKPETRTRVEAAMRELGYHPNAMARSLASRRSNVISLIYPADERGVGGTGGEFVHSAAARARELGYQLVLWPFRSDQVREVRNLVRQGMADGVLVMEVLLDDERIDVLEAAKVPYTMIGRTRDVSERHSVDVDFDATVVAAVDHLVGLGHRHIGFINHSQGSLDAGYGPTVRAAAAFERAMAERGLTPLARTCEDSPLAGRQATAGLLATEPDLTALITMNEMATFGVFAELQYRRLAIPDDVSVLGIVTSPGVGTMSYPTLTTMHSPGVELGRLAVDRLISQLDPAHPATPNRLIPCVLEPGMSIGPARTGKNASPQPR
ncbi:MAG TPA: LacI family DNA-binding transcriptional regulator [Propionicimonas sp.]|nr:LacI family DNA-binding transcriptional regulator [Propionicimonas sp.]HRA06611.1 LacI family DNA-binding transcriptional regulator [Propionicimonas sp.]